MKNVLIFTTLFAFLIVPIPLFAGEGHHHQHHEEEEEEQRVHLEEPMLSKLNIQIDTAGPQDLRKTLRVNGRVSANQNRLAHIHPRFSGVVKEVQKQVGDVVQKGEVLAVIESNQSLQRYEVVSLLEGTVIFRHATIGEFVREEEPIFVVADLSTVWVDLFVYPRDFEFIRHGQTVRIKPPHTADFFESTLSFVSNVVDEQTQAKVARAVLANKNGALYPDQYVEAEIELEKEKIPLGVKSSAIVRLGEKTVVFVKEDHAFEPRDVLVNRSDSLVTEILSGISKGTAYASGNTYFLKAELGKASVEHSH